MCNAGTCQYPQYNNAHCAFETSVNITHMIYTLCTQYSKHTSSNISLGLMHPFLSAAPCRRTVFMKIGLGPCEEL